MPLFEVDATRPLLVQGAGGAAGGEPGVHTSAHRVVESHIDGLLGEQVFPVAQGSGPDEPHLLALDASGLPIVVELVGDLDKSTLTRALDHAGAAGRLTRGELASRYNGGPQNFAHDVADFYDSVPITQSSSPKAGGGARLIIICQNAPQEILNAVDFLRQPTMPVEVLKMDVVRSDDGRRFLDVSPLVIHLPPGLPSPRQEDRGSITRGGQPEQLSAKPAAPTSKPMFTPQSSPDPESFVAGVKVGYALTGKLPVVAHQPGAGGSADAESAAGPRRRVPGTEADTDRASGGRASGPAEHPAPGTSSVHYPASGPTSAPPQSFAERGPRTTAAASPPAASGANPAKGLRRSLAGGGTDASAERSNAASAASRSEPAGPGQVRPATHEPTAATPRPAADGGRTLPPSRAARRAMAERANATQAQAPGRQADAEPSGYDASGPAGQWSVPPLSAERPGPAAGAAAPVSSPVAQQGRPPAPTEAPAPLPGDPSVPASDTVPRVRQSAPTRRRSRSDRFATPPHEPPMGGAPMGDPPSSEPTPISHADAPTLVGGVFTAHEPVPPPPAPIDPATIAPPSSDRAPIDSAPIDSAPGASTFQDGYPSGSFGSVESAPFQPPVIDSRSTPAPDAPSEPMTGQRNDPGYPRMSFGQDVGFGQDPGYGQDPGVGQDGGYGQDAGYQPDVGYGQDTAYHQDAAYEQDVGYRQDVGFGQDAGYGQGQSGATDPGFGQDPAGYTAPDQWQEQAYPWTDGPEYAAPEPAPFPGQAAAPFPGQAPEAHIPPIPPDESIRANTPGLFDEEDDPDLEALARSFGAPTRIVWSRPRRSQHYEAVLHPNGVIELADGGQYRHPDTAATAASGSYTADGWSVWRIGEQGPSLTEAFQQRFV